MTIGPKRFFNHVQLQINFFKKIYTRRNALDRKLNFGNNHQQKRAEKRPLKGGPKLRLWKNTQG